MDSITAKKYLTIAFCITVLAALYSCKSSEQATGDRPVTTVSDSATATVTSLKLDQYRNRLSDLYVTQQHDIPIFMGQSQEEGASTARNPYNGFRIQIISTRNQVMADSVANSFRMWADTTIVGYSPDAHVSFNQPHYKVHVGDFHNRDRAYTFSRIVKGQYPDAWVVHDRIDPYAVPADSIEIRLRTEADDTLNSQQDTLSTDG